LGGWFRNSWRFKIS